MHYYWWLIGAKRKRLIEKGAMWIAWHLVPRQVRMWVVVRAYAAAWAKPPYKTPDQLRYGDVMAEVM